MSLNKRLSKTKEKSEEKIITLRMPQNKVQVLEFLSKHYGINMSTLIRDMIDESLVKLAKENLLLSEEAGMIIDKEDGKHNIRCFSDVLGCLVPELPIEYDQDDIRTQKDIDQAVFEMVKLSYEYGFSVTDSWINPQDNDHEISRKFTKKTKVEK
jgi:predicted DNA-binding protein